MSKNLCVGAARAAYYLIGRFLPKYPIPGYKFAYRFRHFLCKHIFESIGKNVLLKEMHILEMVQKYELETIHKSIRLWTMM